MSKEQNQDTTPVFDPYDEQLKKSCHSKADAKNRVVFANGRYSLRCGAKKRKPKSDGEMYCRSYAGVGTDHPGYGRCKHCGGCSTGPKTEEGKARAAVNARTHGFYSKALRGEELATYESLLESKEITLMDEIMMLKAKILTYLSKWQTTIDSNGEKAARNYVTTGIDQERSYYTASTADDRVLQRALETLRRLVDSHAKLTQDTSIGLLDSINKELKDASQGEVTLAWKARPAQQRKAADKEGK